MKRSSWGLCARTALPSRIVHLPDVTHCGVVLAAPQVSALCSIQSIQRHDAPLRPLPRLGHCRCSPAGSAALKHIGRLLQLLHLSLHATPLVC